jgi:hypothetical protein
MVRISAAFDKIEPILFEADRTRQDVIDLGSSSPSILEFNYLEKQFNVRLIEQYDSNERQDWIRLCDKATVQLEFLI